MAILLVEQNVEAALKLAEGACMLETDRITASRPARDSDPAIVKAYLGAGAARKIRAPLVSTGLLALVAERKA